MADNPFPHIRFPEILPRLSPGVMTHVLTELGDGPEVAMMVRETPVRVRRVPPGPVVVFRASVLNTASVIPVLMLVRIGPGTDDVYATWLNGWAVHGGLEHLRKLAVQLHISVLLHAERHVERIFHFPNSLRAQFAKAAERS
ncbi:MAG: hypothetical protein FJX78_07570 [Armatimonadetes bacterium]|nr:hypothetical protein [Armatimonadota bacterium]